MFLGSSGEHLQGRDETWGGLLSSVPSAPYTPWLTFAGSASGDPECCGESRTGGAGGSWRAADRAQFWGRGARALSL